MTSRNPCHCTRTTRRAAACLSLLALLAGPAAAPLRAESARPMAEFTLADFRGKPWSLGEAAGRPVVVVFLGTECPLVRLYAARLVELAERLQPQVTFVGIDANQQDSLAEMAHFARTLKLNFPLLKDPGNVVADQFGAKRTPEVFLLDGERKVRYHGRIDDQYTYGIQKPKVSREYLVEAVNELLAGKPVSIPETEVVGCHIGRKLEPDPESDVTYARQISRILQRRCVECHRKGEVAPFALTEYDEVVGWAEMIAEVVESRRMPPWHADPQYGEFHNDARLTEEERRQIEQWVAAGAPLGDPAELPPPREFTEGWRIGQPDLVLYMSQEPFQVPAEGEVKYQHFVVDPGFQEDKWIKAAECRPGNRAVVHHIIVAAASREELANPRHIDLESDWLTATAPGARPLILPDGMAKRVPAGSKLIFQLHYTPNGTSQQDRSCVGFIFADREDVKHQVVTQKAVNHRFRIPPGAENHRVEAEYTFRKDGLMLAMFPHMHLRGKSFRYTAHYPDGRSEVLLDVPHYDFAWQNSYEFLKPKHMAAGTRLECVAHFDNSDRNLANPDPTVTVRWGDQTWEEMMIGYFDLALLDELPPPQRLTRRTDQFLDALNQHPEHAERMLARVEEARAGQQDWKRLAEAMLPMMPQLDRVDWITVDDQFLTIRQAFEGPHVKTAKAAGAGVKLPARSLRLAEYARQQRAQMHADLAEVSSPDFRLLSQFFSSSLHLPFAAENGEAGLVSFYSSEKAAFPPQAVELLTEVVSRLSDSRKTAGDR